MGKGYIVSPTMENLQISFEGLLQNAKLSNNNNSKNIQQILHYINYIVKYIKVVYKSSK